MLKNFYLLEDVTKGEKKPYFTSLKGDCVDLLSGGGEEDETAIIRNRDGERTTIQKNLLSSTPPPNGPELKDKPVPVAKPDRKPINPTRTTSPVKRPVSKVKHIGAAKLF